MTEPGEWWRVMSGPGMWWRICGGLLLVLAIPPILSEPVGPSWHRLVPLVNAIIILCVIAGVTCLAIGVIKNSNAKKTPH